MASSSTSSNSSTSPVVAYAEVYKKNKVYLGPRKDDGDVVDTFHYGDGKWVVSFVYQKNSKASERAGSETKSEVNTEDKGGKKVTLSPNQEANILPINF